MHCIKCGNKISENTSFCGGCGNAVSVDVSKTVDTTEKSNNKTVRNIIIIIGCLLFIPIVLIIISMFLLYFPIWS